jgi:hypothetical protein
MIPHKRHANKLDLRVINFISFYINSLQLEMKVRNPTWIPPFFSKLGLLQV